MSVYCLDTNWLKGTEAGLVYLTCWGDVGATVTNESLT